MRYSAEMTYRDPIAQCLTNCNADKLRCKSPWKDNRDIASASFLLRISKPYQPDNRSSLNAPLGKPSVQVMDQERIRVLEVSAHGVQNVKRVSLDLG